MTLGAYAHCFPSHGRQAASTLGRCCTDSRRLVTPLFTPTTGRPSGPRRPVVLYNPEDTALSFQAPRGDGRGASAQAA